MRNQEASSVVKSLEQGWFLRHGYPLAVLSDQGRNVDGTMVNALCRSLGIVKLRSSPYHPQGDGQAERSIETFKQAMRCLLEERHIEETDWPALLQEVMFVCNSYVNASTGYSPNEVMYSARLRCKADAVFPFREQKDFTNIQSYCNHAEKSRKEVIDKIHQSIMNSQRRMERNYNRGSKTSNVESGDWVWLKNDARPNSLSPMYKGPWLVVDRRGVNLQLSDQHGTKSQFVHMNRCKKAAHNAPQWTEVDISNQLREGPATSTESDRSLPSEIDAEGGVSESEGSIEDGQDMDQSHSSGTLDASEIGQPRRSGRERREPDRYGEWY